MMFSDGNRTTRIRMGITYSRYTSLKRERDLISVKYRECIDFDTEPDAIAWVSAFIGEYLTKGNPIEDPRIVEVNDV